MNNISKLLKWLCTGFLALALTTLLLYICVDILKFDIGFSTVASAEIVTLMRFFLLNRWVFGRFKVTFNELLKYHLANSVAFIAWLIIINLLVSSGVYYLFANIATVLVTTAINLLTNFKWVWKEEWKRELEQKKLL